MPGVDDEGDGYIDDCHGIDTINHDSDPDDDFGHGTHTGGTIGEVGNNALGATGMNWNVTVLPCKSHDNTGNGTNDSLIECLQFIQDWKARGLNVVTTSNSYGGCNEACDFSQSLYDAIKAHMDNGILFVASAGNDAANNDVTPKYPTNYYLPNVIGVAATTNTDSLAFFSNYGRTTADLGAPGLRILSTARYLVNPPRYANYSGTSPAAALVSAGAALVFALNPQNWDGAGAAAWTPADVIQHLAASADTIEDLKLACIGGKRLNLGRAVYGPLHVTAPTEGATVHVGVPTIITWTNEYTNPSFTQVKVEFSKDDGATYGATLAASANNDGHFNWTPAASQATGKGRIRITPTKGNFPALSGRLKVV